MHSHACNGLLSGEGRVDGAWILGLFFKFFLLHDTRVFYECLNFKSITDVNILFSFYSSLLNCALLLLLFFIFVLVFFIE